MKAGQLRVGELPILWSSPSAVTLGLLHSVTLPFAQVLGECSMMWCCQQGAGMWWPLHRLFVAFDGAAECNRVRPTSDLPTRSPPPLTSKQTVAAGEGIHPLPA